MCPHRSFGAGCIALAHGIDDGAMLILHAGMVAGRREREKPEAQRPVLQLAENVTQHVVLAGARDGGVKLAIEQHHLLAVARRHPLLGT